MKFIWTINQEVDSKTAYNHLRETETPMSRASVINFLNKMANKGFLQYSETTTKGGYKGLYRPSVVVPDEKSFKRVLAKRIIYMAQKELSRE